MLTRERNSLHVRVRQEFSYFPDMPPSFDYYLQSDYRQLGVTSGIELGGEKQGVEA